MYIVIIKKRKFSIWLKMIKMCNKNRDIMCMLNKCVLRMYVIKSLSNTLTRYERMRKYVMFTGWTKCKLKYENCQRNLIAYTSRNAKLQCMALIVNIL